MTKKEALENALAEARPSTSLGADSGVVLSIILFAVHAQYICQIITVHLPVFVVHIPSSFPEKRDKEACH